MAEHAYDDKDTTGYFLPEDSQLLLTQVCNHVKFLARLARPRIADETQEWAPEVRMSELMFCLDQVAEQLDLVLKEVTWPAQRTVTQEATEAPQDAVGATEARETDPPAQAEEIPQDTIEAAQEAVDASEADETVPPAQAESDPFVFGVTMDQLDQLHLLADRITAYGDAVSADDMADFAPGTLSILGHTIFDRANELDEIVTEINAQPLEEGKRRRSAVNESKAAYCMQLPFEAGYTASEAPALVHPLPARSLGADGLYLH